MKSKLFCLLAIGAIVIGICNAAPVENNEEEARKFAEYFSQNINKLADDLASSTFNDKPKQFDPEQTLLNITNEVIDLVNESKKFDYKNFKDEELKNIFGKIRKFAEEAIVGADQHETILYSLTALEELGSDKDISGYKNDSIELSYFPDVQNIIVKSTDPLEILHYWNSWRDINSAWASNRFVDLVMGIRDAANLTEMTAFDFWMKDYDLKEMEVVLAQIQPFFNEMHGFIRYKLNKKYGDEFVKTDGLIPDHLFRQVLAQAWTSGSIIDDIYPHKDLPPYDSILEQNDFDTPKIYKMADQFYQSLGFDSIPEDFWGTRIQMKTSEDEGDCKASIYEYTSNIYMQYCQKMDFRKFLQAHGYLGQLYYAREKDGLPAYYFEAHDLQYPVGEAVILSASTPKHLNAVGIVTDFKFTEDVLMNRLVRLSIHTMLNIPLHYVHTKVMADLFAGTINMTDLNKHYWKLMDQYVGVGPPGDREVDTFDFPFNFYIEMNENRQARKFDSEILGYQFYKKMCSISEQYPKEPLQNCDFYGSKKVGDVLKKMMKLGSSKSFEKVLEVMLPEDAKLNAESLLEYYSPVQTWVTEKNHEAGVKLGWTHLDKTIGSVYLPTLDDFGTMTRK